MRANPARYRLMFDEGFPTVSQHGQAMRDLRKRCYDIMKSNLGKRLSDAELPVAGYFSGRLCMVSGCCSSTATSSRIKPLETWFVGFANLPGPDSAILERERLPTTRKGLLLKEDRKWSAYPQNNAFDPERKSATTKLAYRQAPSCLPSVRFGLLDRPKMTSGSGHEAAQIRPPDGHGPIHSDRFRSMI